MKKLTFIAAIVLCSILMFTSACSKQSTEKSSVAKEATNSATTSEEPKVLKIAVEPWMIEKLYLNDAIAKFKAKHPDVEVSIQPYPDPNVLSNFTLKWSQNKTDVDILVFGGTHNAIQYLAKDLIIDFNKTDFFDKDTAKDKFIGQTLSYGSLDGVQFAIPISLEAYAINVNKKMFQEAGLTDTKGEIIPPKNWQEIYEYAKKMTKKEGGKVVQQGMVIQWGTFSLETLVSVEQASRGSIFNDKKVLTFDTPEVREILDIWKKGKDEGVFSIDTFTDQAAGRNNYKAGQVAMLLESNRVPEATPTIGKENAAILPIPGSEQKGSYGFSAGVVIPKATKSPKLAVQFIKEALMDEEIQAKAASNYGKLPVINAAFNKIDAVWKPSIVNIINKSVLVPFYRDIPVLGKNMPILLQNYLTGKLDKEAFIKEVEKTISEMDKSTK